MTIQANGVGVMAKLGALTRKQLRALIAVLVALAVVVPGMIVGFLHVFAADSTQGQQRYVNELVTSKTVSPTGNRGEYNVRLESYTTSEGINYPPTDIVLVLDLSGSMNNPIGDTQYVNLNTHTMFESHKFNEVLNSTAGLWITYNDFHDSKNKHNFIGGVSLGAGNEGNKYVEDPHAPGNYVYIASRYTFTGPTFGRFQFFITDSLGNEYSTQQTGIVSVAARVPSTFEFTCTKWVDEKYKNEKYYVDRFWTRTENNLRDNCLNKNLYDNYRNNLWIQDDSGNWCQVSLTKSSDFDDYYNSGAYIYSFTDTNDVTHIYSSVQGNQEYGADYGVFQGFKRYEYVTDGEGHYVYDSLGNKKLRVIHEESIESKSLYYKVTSAEDETRLQAMKEAVEKFIIDVHSNAFKRDIDQRIAVVTFNNGSKNPVPLTDVRDETDMNRIIDTIYDFTANNGTQIQEGMWDAYDILRNPNSNGRNKVVVAFTDGVPTKTGIGSSYSTDAATSAIDYANRIEGLATPATATTQATTANVYSIGLFTGADSNQMHGSMFYHSGMQGIFFDHSNKPCSGAVGSQWGRTNIAGLGNSDMSDVDAAATNRFLNLLSSNYRTATTVGIKKVSGLIKGQGYEITANYPRTGDDYYFGTQSEDELYNAFKKIAEDVAIPETKLEAQTHLFDTVTDSFNIVGNVEVFTEEVNAAGTEWTPTNDVLEIDEAKLADKIIDVTGFDYSQNYVTAPDGQNPAGNYGKKVVVEFTIQTIENFVGGNSVPTNGRDSGVYGSDMILVEDFEYPLKDIETQYSVEAQDHDIYLNDFADLMELLNLPENEAHSPVIDGKTNEFVNMEYVVTNEAAITEDNPDGVVFTYLIPAGKDSDNGILSLQEADVAKLYPALKDNTTYHVTCNVTPTVSGDAQPISPSDDATVYVYKPFVAVEDQHRTYSEGQAGVDLQVESIEWKADGKEDSRTEADGAPHATYKVKDLTRPATPATPIDDYVLGVESNFQVYDFTIPAKTGETYTADYTCYVRNSGSGDDKYVIASEYQGTPTVEEFQVQRDEEGNILYVTDEDGNQVLDNGNPIPIFIMETRTITRPLDSQSLNDDDPDNGDFVTYKNISDPADAQNPRVDGEFTVFITKTFKVQVQKVFSGSYAVVDDVTITIKDAEQNTIASHKFDADDFNGLSSDTILLKDNNDVAIEFECAESYTISESFADIEHYNVSYDAKDANNQAVGTTGANNTYTFTTDTENDVITIKVNNAWNSAYDPTVTGVSKEQSSVTPIIILSVILVAAGGTTAYVVYRKKEATE